MLRFFPELKPLRYFCSKAAPKNKIYSKTVILPQTSFPLRLEKEKLSERDTFLSNSNEFKGLYAWQEKNLSDPEFILHDGPPYANGPPHLGHATNKILKDIILRIKILEGRKVHYVPGWDCHGLPIELKAITKAKESLTPVQIRQKARNFAKMTIEKQKEAFQSWGVIGDWNNIYTTYSNNYIKNQIRQFYELYKKDLVFRDFKPVYWSPSSRTALAEAELEYNDNHKSTAIILKLKIVNGAEMLQKYLQRLYCLIWTTTPWTLPSNQAVSFNPNLSYSLVQNSNNEVYIIATDLIESVSKSLNKTLEVLESFSGSLLKDAKYVHPIKKNIICPLLTSSHATSTKGTGLVHTAPAHGPEDFLVALSNKMPVKCLVNEDGQYSSEAGHEFEGLFVLEEGNSKVIDFLRNDILHMEEFIHSYPYDWRTKKPVILRASEQWFINTEQIKQRCVDLIDGISIIPKINSEKLRKNLVGQITRRPYWCISRQRVWGVPIPVLYQKSTGKLIINEISIEHFCKLLDKHGPDFWWSLPESEILNKSFLEEMNLKPDDVERKKDILDIWFDSGLSWSSVLDGKTADFYLEGVDQCTGWFQSSLLLSVALKDVSPYKNLYVHGFVVDENGLKMSKSLGNVIDPRDILKGAKGKKPYGIDTLRWWVACHGNQDSTTSLGTNVLQCCADDVQKIRSTMRFALGALKDYNGKTAQSELLLIDRYMMHLLSFYNTEVENYLKEYQFNKVGVAAINFLTNAVSAMYYTAVKDRLYCDYVDSHKRRCAQFVLYNLFHVIAKSVAPIIPHLIEEMYIHLPQKQDGSFFQNIQSYVLGSWKNDSVNELMEIILDVKKDVNKEVGANTVGFSLQMEVSEDFLTKLLQYNGNLDVVENELCDIFQVSTVKIELNNNLDNRKYGLTITKSHFYSCNRCRRVSSQLEDELCNRCNLVVQNSNKEAVTV